MLSPIKATEMLNKLQKIGCIMIRQNGSHVVLRYKGKTMIVPFHGSKDIPLPTMKSILKQGGISEKNSLSIN